MNQAKKNNFRPQFWLIRPKVEPLPPIFFSCGLYLMLEIVVNYHCMQCQGTLAIQTQKIAKNLIFGAEFWAENNESNFVFYLNPLKQ